MLCAKEIKIAYEVGSAFSLKDDELDRWSKMKG